MCPIRMTRIDLLRHGETVSGPCYRGSIDDDLTPQGWASMQGALDAAGRWDHIVSSPLRRCADFARDLAQRLALPLALDARLREIHFGDWEGRTASELLASDPEALTAFWQDPVQHPPPGAEDVRALEARVLLAWEELVSRYDGERVLVVSHGGPLRIILGRVQKLSLAESMRLEVPQARCFHIQVQQRSEAAQPDFVLLARQS